MGQEVWRLHDDQELRELWEEDQDRKMIQLGRKEELRTQMRYKPVHLDVMFMKLQSVSSEGFSVPKNEPLDLGSLDSAGPLRTPAGEKMTMLDRMLQGPRI